MPNRPALIDNQSDGLEPVQNMFHAKMLLLESGTTEKIKRTDRFMNRFPTIFDEDKGEVINLWSRK